MIVRCFIVLMLLHEVSLQVTVEGVIGSSIVLPCSASKDQLTIQDITVYWQHNETISVYDIIKGKGSVESQKPQYKNRTGTFPEEYLKGNFSLQLTNLQNNDAGTYSCFITQESTIRKVKLLIKETSVEDKSNHGAQTGPEKIVTMSLLCISILLCMT